jgi:DMSO/TMAO reductase YedYZ molybdopterin-dependent catalytic subunit
MSNSISRRDLIRLGGGGLMLASASKVSGRLLDAPIAGGTSLQELKPSRALLTNASDFEDVTRNDPPPTDLATEQLKAARLTAETWRLEIVGDESTSAFKQRRLEDNTAVGLPELEEFAKKSGVKYLKAMQCLNIAQPLGQGLWEGIPVATILRMLGPLENVRRIYYWGYHNDDPKQLFQSSLSYSQAMETPPGELPAFLALRLNGEPLPLERGGPVRMIVPWAHGFKSIKWLQKLVLTNDYKPNDTYALQNNDPESWLKSAAYLDELPTQFQAGRSVVVRGTVISGRSGVARVECWLARLKPSQSVREPGDLEMSRVPWQPASIDPAPSDWSTILPVGVRREELLGFDRASGRPLEWPLRYGMASWSMTLDGLEPGKYEIRARAVDANGFAQPEPRPYQKSGRNAVPTHVFNVTA